MRFAIFAVTSLASLASASRAIAKRCELSMVQFHFNSTELGSVESCSKDVMNRGPVVPTLQIRQTNGSCVDGPKLNYTVVSGDTLEKLAAEYSSGVCNIAKASGIDNPDFINIADVLTIPTNVCEANIDNQSCRTVAGEATCVENGSPTYQIVAGDTFFLIASRLGITLESLVAVNPGVDAGNLQIGDTINIPVCGSQ